MCHGQAGLLLLSFSFILSLFPHSLRFLLFIGWCRSRTTNQFQSLSQWGLTGQFVSLRGNRIHSSVPQKTLFFQTEGAFCLVTIAIELLQFMWLIQIEVLRCISGGGGGVGGHDGMLCTLQASYVIMRGDVCNEQSNCYIECLETKLPNDSKLSVW